MPVVTCTEVFEKTLIEKILKGESFISRFFHWKHVLINLPANVKKYKYNLPSDDIPKHTLIVEHIKRDGDLKKDFTKYDNLNLENIQATLNNVPFPEQYQGDPLYFYRSFKDFYRSFYGKEPKNSMIDFGDYERDYHIKHIDCSSFDAESTASFKLDNRWGKPIPEGTVQHVIIITEKECNYYPLTEKVLV